MIDMSLVHAAYSQYDQQRGLPSNIKARSPRELMSEDFCAGVLRDGEKEFLIPEIKGVVERFFSGREVFSVLRRVKGGISPDSVFEHYKKRDYGMLKDLIMECFDRYVEDNPRHPSYEELREQWDRRDDKKDGSTKS